MPTQTREAKAKGNSSASLPPKSPGKRGKKTAAQCKTSASDNNSLGYSSDEVVDFSDAEASTPVTPSQSVASGASASRERLPLNIEKQLISDIEAAGGIAFFDLGKTQGLRILLDSTGRADYGKVGDKIRVKIGRRVHYFKTNTEVYRKQRQKLNVEPVVLSVQQLRDQQGLQQPQVTSSEDQQYVSDLDDESVASVKKTPKKKAQASATKAKSSSKKAQVDFTTYRNPQGDPSDDDSTQRKGSTMSVDKNDSGDQSGTFLGRDYDAKIIVTGTHFKHPPFKVERFEQEEVEDSTTGRIDFVNGYGITFTHLVRKDWLDGLVKAELLGSHRVLVTVPSVPFPFRERYSGAYKQPAENLKSIPAKLVDEHTVDNALSSQMKGERAEGITFKFLFEFPSALSMEVWNTLPAGDKDPKMLEDRIIKGGYKTIKADQPFVFETATWVVCIAGSRRPKKNPKTLGKGKMATEVDKAFTGLNLDDDFDGEEDGMEN
jgi:hypothetical protein